MERIKKLKAENGPELHVHGSGNLIQTLRMHDLVDELLLKTFPVVLGTGKHPFVDGTMPGGWEHARQSGLAERRYRGYLRARWGVEARPFIQFDSGAGA